MHCGAVFHPWQHPTDPSAQPNPFPHSTLLTLKTQRSMKMHHTYCEPHTFQTFRFTFLFILPAWLFFAQITMQSTQLCKNLSICFSSGIGELNAQNKTVVYHNKYLWKNSAVQTCSLNSAQSRNIHRATEHMVCTRCALCTRCTQCTLCANRGGVEVAAPSVDHPTQH